MLGYWEIEMLMISIQIAGAQKLVKESIEVHKRSKK